jgi:GNAT superfamily N-acetyltransferase
MKIEVISNKIELKNREKLIQLVLKQMETIGSKKSYKQIEDAIDNALSDNKRSLFFLSYIKNDIAAFAFANICAGLESGADYLWINELYVEENFRRKNIASEIISFIEIWTKKQRIKYIACITGVDNISAKKLYQKKGYNLNKTIWVDKRIE